MLALEVSLTRLFAWVLHNHFAFFAISLAVCGLGLGAYAAHLLLARRASAERLLAASAWGFSIATLAALALVTRVIVTRAPAAFALVGAIVLVPFLLAGVALALLFRAHPSASARLYAADLAGAAAAAAGTLVLLDAAGAIGAIVIVAGASALLPLFLAGRRHVLPALVLAVACAIFAAVPSARAIFDVPLDRASLAPITERLVADEAWIREHEGKMAPDDVRHVVKGLLVALADPNSAPAILHTEWNAFGRTDVTGAGAQPETLEAWLDGDVPAVIRRADAATAEADRLRRHPAFLPYRLAQPKRVLSLGSGGGFDVVLAKLGGATSVDAVEINPAIPNVMARFHDFHGGVYEQPGVAFHLTDGRSFVKQAEGKWDLVVLSLTQAATSSYSGTALMESYIHTQEACEEYLRRLDDDGLLMFVGGYSMHAFRWLATSCAALERECGVRPADVLRHQILVASPDAAPYQYAVVTSRRPFGDAALRAAEAIASEPGTTLELSPSRPPAPPFDRLAQDDAATGAYVAFGRESAHVNLSPSTDDSPFFIDVTTTIPAPLWQLLGFAAGVTLVFAVVAIAASRSSGSAPALAARTAYFACLGVGFMLVEIGLVQRLLLLLGRPTHTVALLLFSMLLGAAGGSAIADRTLEAALPRRAVLACALVAVIALVLGFGISPLADVLLRSSLPLRAAAAVAIGAALGAAMGVPFPAGLRLAARESADSVSYLWGVNGVTSVVGSVLAAIAGRAIGFSHAILLGGLVYALAATFALALSRRAAPAAAR